MSAVVTPPSTSARGGLPRRIALLGNPNVGKTTLFNRLCGLRSKTANFPGSTVEAHTGSWAISSAGEPISVVDLPGVYAIDLDLPESALCRDCLLGKLEGCEPDALVVVLDATNLPRNLQFLASIAHANAAQPQPRPMVVAITMADIAARKGLSIDERLVSEHLGCPVTVVSGRTGEGIDRLAESLKRARASVPTQASGETAATWAARVVEESVGGDHAVGTDHDSVADRLDAAFTHPFLGTLIFAGVMAGLFLTIFLLAEWPMTLIEGVFGALGTFVTETLSEGILSSLLSDGVLGGLEGTLVFLPQICLLFFLVSLLEDTGYLARAAFVMDRVMCRFGLPGQAFVPLLSSHACALPGIMSARLIPDRRDRLATILVAPFLSCSARVPVYVLLTTVLFRNSPWLAGLAFAGCYVLGATAALLTAFLFRRTILKGSSRPMVLELPSYKLPSLRTALYATYDRAKTFLTNAGTIIMAICIVMWWLSAFPRIDPTPAAEALRAEAAAIVASDEAATAKIESLRGEADAIDRREQSAQSFAGQAGTLLEPAFAPLGFERQLTVATLTSFLAREVFVSTLAILSGTDEEDERMIDTLATAKRDDGTPLLTTATSASLLIFFVLAMQCLPTLAVTRRETGSWSWAALQFGWMSFVAYCMALITYQGLHAFGVA